MLSAPDRWCLWRPGLSLGCCSWHLCRPHCFYSGRWHSGATLWTRAAAASSEQLRNWIAPPWIHMWTKNKTWITTEQQKVFFLMLKWKSSVFGGLTLVPLFMSAPNQTGLLALGVDLVHQALRGTFEGFAEMQVSPVSMLQNTLMASLVLPWFGSSQ